MRLEHPEEKIDIVGRLRDFENALVDLRIRKSDPQGEFAGDEIDAAQSQGELLQKPAEHEQERLSCFDLMIELKTFVEGFRRLNKFEQAIRLTICTKPEGDRLI